MTRNAIIWYTDESPVEWHVVLGQRSLRLTVGLDIMRTTVAPLLLLIFVLQAASAAESNPLSDVLNNFSSRLFQQFVRRHEGQTMCVYSFSTSMDLSILLLGSRGETRAELIRVLGFEGLIDSSNDLKVHRLFKDVSKSFRYMRSD